MALRYENERVAHSETKLRGARDDLTGIYNRPQFRRVAEDMLNNARRAEHDVVSVAFIDINNFKLVNDTMGHAGGDAVIQAVADALRACVVRTGDVYGRLSGDEFAVLLPHTDEVGARIVLEKVNTKFQHIARKLYGEHVHVLADRVSLSYGVEDVECMKHAPAPDLTELLTVADQRMYQHKERVKNGDVR
jgi:diguanylate cyclase (GGDEF)-like protein